MYRFLQVTKQNLLVMHQPKQMIKFWWKRPPPPKPKKPSYVHFWREQNISAPNVLALLNCASRQDLEEGCL